MFLLHVIFIAHSLAITARSQNVNTFWNDYPACERQCHQTVYGNQSCTLQNSCACAGCLCLADSCLCVTPSWLIAVSQCIGQQCGAAAVSDAAGIANGACNGNGYPLAVSVQDLIADGLAAIPATVTLNSAIPTTATPNTATSTAVVIISATQAPTPAPSSQSSSSSGGGRSGLSTAVIAVISVVATLVVVGTIAGIAIWHWKSNREKKKKKADLDAAHGSGGAQHYGPIAGWVVEMPDREGLEPKELHCQSSAAVRESKFSSTTQIGPLSELPAGQY